VKKHLSAYLKVSLIGGLRPITCSREAHSVEVRQLKKIQEQTETDHNHQEVYFQMRMQLESRLRVDDFEPLDHLGIEITLPFYALI